MIKYTAKRDEGFEAQLGAWIDKITMVPKTYPTLTEKQWLDACCYFGGCAKCGSETIEARGFFIPFELGGRYCDWNVVPLCDVCANELQKCKNPFRLAWLRDNRSRSNVRRTQLINTIEYLEVKLNDAIRTGEELACTTESAQ